MIYSVRKSLYNTYLCNNLNFLETLCHSVALSSIFSAFDPLATNQQFVKIVCSFSVSKSDQNTPFHHLQHEMKTSDHGIK